MPCRGSIKFTTATNTQPGVIVRVGEDVSHYADSELDIHPLNSFTFMLYKLSPEEEKLYANRERLITITIVINDEGQLKCHCHDGFDPEHNKESGEKLPMGSEEWKLVLFGVVMFVLYVAARISFAKLDVVGGEEEEEVVVVVEDSSDYEF